jgi:bifunctional non-homologous end joining protein LigD
MPYLLDRPQSLHRFPDGIQKAGFFQKDVGTKIPEWLNTVQVPLETGTRKIRYLVCTDLASLAYMVNLGCIEMHPWFSRVGKLDNPDYLVLDLDPEGVKFDGVVETALVVKKLLDRAGAPCFCKTSGATGLHIFVPLKAKYDYDVAKNFAHLIARMVNAELPRLTSLERSPEKRKKKVYIDFLQNTKGQTVVAPYSVRPRPGAPVSTPLEWDELRAGLDPKEFTIQTIFQRLKKKGDLFKKVLGPGIDIEAGLEKLGEG